MNNSHYSSDSPIHEEKDDKFYRWGFAKRISEVVATRKCPDGIIIGLNGAWGAGKTTTLNFIEENLLNNEDVICIKFNPWRLGSEVELLKGLFTDIANAIEAKLEGASKKLKSIAEKLIPVINVGSPTAAALVQSGASFLSSKDISELKEKLEEELCKKKKRILILVDDIDRLEKQEIQAIFKIVKLTANFKYTAYILAFDKGIVASSLQDHYAHFGNNSGEAFLEKIIQIPIDLPLIEQTTLLELCLQKVSIALDQSKISLTDEQSNELIRHFTTSFRDCLNTPRKIDVFGNILLFSLPILAGEVNPLDLICIEGIRVFTPSIYQILKSNMSQLLMNEFNNNLSANSEADIKTKELLDNSLDKIENIDNSDYLNLLKHLFPKLGKIYGSTLVYDVNDYYHWDREKRICAENYINRYFTYSISIHDIADGFISEAISELENWNEPFQEDNNPLRIYLNNDNSGKAIQKLRSKANLISCDHSFKLALAVAQISDLLPNYDEFAQWVVPFSQAAILINTLIENSNSDKIDLAKRCIDQTTSIYFKLEIFEWLKREKDGVNDKTALSKNDINKIGTHLGKSLRKHLEEHDITSDILRYIPTILYRCKEYLGQKYVSKYVEKLVNENSDSVLKILEAYSSKQWSLSGISEPGIFDRGKYNRLAEVIDPNLFVNKCSSFDLDINEIKEFPEQGTSSDPLLQFKQFVWLYNHTEKNFNGNNS